ATQVCLLISALHGDRIERKRRDGIDGNEYRTRCVPRVVRFEVAFADIARRHAVAAVTCRERRDTRTVVVRAERTGWRGKRPLARAASADQLTIPARRDDRELRLPCTERALRARRDRRPLREDFGAS